MMTITIAAITTAIAVLGVDRDVGEADGGINGIPLEVG